MNYKIKIQTYSCIIDDDVITSAACDQSGSQFVVLIFNNYNFFFILLNKIRWEENHDILYLFSYVNVVGKLMQIDFNEYGKFLMQKIKCLIYEGGIYIISINLFEIMCKNKHIHMINLYIEVSFRYLNKDKSIVTSMYLYYIHTYIHYIYIYFLYKHKVFQNLFLFAR